MYAHADKIQENEHRSERQVGSKAVFQLQDNRPRSVAQRNRVQNKTGLPDQLKTGIENLSGHSMNDVKVHYNSAKPAQLNAHAFAQGTDIHIASGQEKHLPHEAWHVVQQKQGRVRPTLQMKGKVSINDDRGLENEADRMGQKALQFKQVPARGPADGLSRRGAHSSTVQRSTVLSNAYQNLEPPTETIVKALVRWTGLPRGTVEQDLNIAGWAMSRAQFNTLTHGSLPRPTSVHALLDHNAPGVRDNNVQTGIGHMGDLEDLLKGRAPSNYHGGHLLGDQYGGFWGDTNTAKNIAPQADNSNTNGGAWYKHEAEVAANLAAGKHVLFEAWVVYPGQTYSVPYKRIKELLNPGSATDNALQNRWLYGIQSHQGKQDTAAAGASLASSVTNAGQSVHHLLGGNIGASAYHGLSSVFSGLSAAWSGAKAAADAVIGVKNQAYVTVNTWAPSQYNLKYVVLRGIKSAPAGAVHRTTFQGGDLGGIAELYPSIGVLLDMFQWWKVPLGPLAPLAGNGAHHLLAFSRLGGDAALQRFNPLYQGYSSASPFGGALLDTQDHALNIQIFEVLNALKEVGGITLAVKYLSVGGYSAANLSVYVLPYVTPWLPGWIAVGITPGLIAGSPALATGLLIWLAYQKSPTVRQHLPVMVQGALDKLGI